MAPDAFDRALIAARRATCPDCIAHHEAVGAMLGIARRLRTPGADAGAGADPP